MDELRPKLWPFDTSIQVTFKLLQLFLPVQLAVEHHAIGHELWFHEFIKMWEVCNNLRYLDNDLIKLMAKLASNNIGFIDWDPYIPLMFARFFRTLSLPVNYKNARDQRLHIMDRAAVGEWIASVLVKKNHNSILNI